MKKKLEQNHRNRTEIKIKIRSARDQKEENKVYQFHETHDGYRENIREKIFHQEKDKNTQRTKKQVIYSGMRKKDMKKIKLQFFL